MKKILSVISIIGVIFLTSASGSSANFQKPEPRFFITTEANVMYRFTSKYINPYRSTSHMYDWSNAPDFISDFIFTPELGFMKKIGDKHAVGASGFFAFNTDVFQHGIRLRYRLQLGRQTYIIVSPGLILGEVLNDYSRADLPAFTGQLCLGFSKWLMLKSEVQVVKRYENYYETYRWTDVSFHGGVALGGTPGLVCGILGGAICSAIVIITIATMWN